jgi:hypothetical protein
MKTTKLSDASPTNLVTSQHPSLGDLTPLAWKPLAP